MFISFQFSGCERGDINSIDTRKTLNVRFGRYNNSGQLMFDTVAIDTTRIKLLDFKEECLIDTVVNGWEYYQQVPYYFQIFKINTKFPMCKAFTKFSEDNELLGLSECDLYNINTFKTNFRVESTKLKKRFWVEYYVISDTSDSKSTIFRFSLGSYLNGIVDTSTFYVFNPCDSLSR